MYEKTALHAVLRKHGKALFANSLRTDALNNETHTERMDRGFLSIVSHSFCEVYNTFYSEMKNKQRLIRQVVHILDVIFFPILSLFAVCTHTCVFV